MTARLNMKGIPGPLPYSCRVTFQGVLTFTVNHMVSKLLRVLNGTRYHVFAPRDCLCCDVLDNIIRENNGGLT